MNFINEKIRVMVSKLEELKVIKSTEISFEYAECPEYKSGANAPAPDAQWKSACSDMRFSGVDTHFWLRFEADCTGLPAGAEPRLCIKTGREGQWDACNPQFTVYINGKTVQAMDVNHTWIPLSSGEKQEIYMYLYTGMNGGNFDVIPRIDIVDLKIESLYYDISVPYDCMKLLDSGSYDYIKIRDCLDKALLLLDLRDVYSQEFYEGIDAAAQYLDKEFYNGICGNSEGVVNCIGHTHIDVAWLWTVAQTREKAQRSFSTVINMIKRYGDYIFMSSQPQLYQFVKEDDPQLYAEIKKAVAAGKWECEGAMWLEADTNLISGESLIRQIIHGKKFMKDEFGVDSKVLWLPDVFGYSGALPQILKKTGVEYFFTSKMFWNETNKMPHDAFEWEGIDGSTVFASFVDSYVMSLKPEHVYRTWKNFKNKDATDRTVLTFGYGDGGGGPTYEMMENYGRLRYGIPGMPKVEIRRAGESLEKIRADFYKNTQESYKRPHWVGEMYLEMHRGTYTSIAKNKKNNRLSEMTQLEAEAASCVDMVLLGGEYPYSTLRKNQTTILLNQFHDIIPGSSIKQVYDVTDGEYETIINEGKSIIKDKLDAVRSNLRTDGGIFVYNPSPFCTSGYINADGRTYFAKDVPAHGWRVIEDSPVTARIDVGADYIENDLVRVEFDGKYNIISVHDKEKNREILQKGAKANLIELYEDYPKSYDAWEITDYYKQKMWIADDVYSAELLENGVRVERKFGKSTISQDITLAPGSKMIGFKTRVDWHEDHLLMKAAFPLDIHSTSAVYDIQFGSIERPTHRNTSWDEAKFEVCAHKWADLSEGDYGVSLLNDCKYGYSTDGGVMSITLLKSAAYPNEEADRGINEFNYWLYPHEGDFRRGGTVMQGYFVNMPMIAQRVSACEGDIPDCYSLVKADSENAVIETIKKAEDDSSIIVRIYDAYNQKSDVTVSAGFDFRKVYLCDMLENNLEMLESTGRDVHLKLGNFEIATLKFVI